VQLSYVCTCVLLCVYVCARQLMPRSSSVIFYVERERERERSTRERERERERLQAQVMMLCLRPAMEDYWISLRALDYTTKVGVSMM
jgi:hypothetical protein